MVHIKEKTTQVLIFILLIMVPTKSLVAIETCSRLAIINYQEVLIDTSSTQKGEGLRFYLEKDPKALSYLEKYQEGTKIKWQNALLGTAGSSLILAGLFSSSSSSESKRALFIGGGSLIAINFLVAATLEATNEVNLLKAVEEYNKRNLPRIYFNPGTKSPLRGKEDTSVFINKTWDF